jgi:murein L,D-transpeptidase YcbB/YkuD
MRSIPALKVLEESLRRHPFVQPNCVLGLSVLAFALVVFVARAEAQDSANWWEGAFQSPGYGESNRREPSARERQPEILNDLRPDATPWRSDEMLIAIERAITKYEQIVSRGGWPSIPGKRMMRPGDDDDRVPALRKVLRATGDLRGEGSVSESYSFDSEVEAAVRRFQERNGLRPSGRADQMTLAALNISAPERLAQLKLNHKRISDLMSMPIEDRYVLVNIPAFQLEAVERYEVAQRHRVIVGRTERQTPTLKASIRGVNFFPYWKVPDSVASLDLVPRMQKDPDYIYKEQIRVIQGDFNGPEVDPRSLDWSYVDTFKYKFRQDPGPRNALGLVRIDMQNEHGVYMHDTPMKELFGQRIRPFSAGCVRVEDVFKLASWITRYEPGWEYPERVDDVLSTGQALDLTLTRPVPVYFTYITAWAERSGRVEFRTDLYNQDGQPATADWVDPDAPTPPPQSLAP